MVRVGALSLLLVLPVSFSGLSGASDETKTLRGSGFPFEDRSSGSPATNIVECKGRRGDGALVNAVIQASEEGAEIKVFGTCVIEQPVILKQGRTYSGVNPSSSRFVQAKAADLKHLLVSEGFVNNWSYTGRAVVLRDFGVDGNNDSNSSLTNGVVVRAWGSTITNLRVQNLSGDGIVISNESEDGTLLETSQVNGIVSEVRVYNVGGVGVHIVDGGNSVTDWAIINNWIGGAKRAGMKLENSAGSIVEGNHIYDSGGPAIVVARAFGSSISGNYIEISEKDFQSSVAVGIEVSVQSGMGSTVIGNRLINGVEGQRAGCSFFRFIQTPGLGAVVFSANLIQSVVRSECVGVVAHGGLGELMLYSSGNAFLGLKGAILDFGDVSVVGGE
ncbi:hypothetical protein ACH42_01190 [Endozoicomonas sp. (ex Bugula neritina AB1)]|nr:hypothetical protein ACH42_01190 [Endozoicomonas sp. (ex Bugula neritina AB1)]